MAGQIAVVVGYFAALLGIGLGSMRRARRTGEDYFLASRTTRPLVLFLTMAATNFSAFTVFGFSGAGWETGYAYYPIMAFGTGFMALTFVLIGRPAWRVGKEHQLVTPPELVYRQTGSPLLRLLFFLVMTAFTLPYLAMQPMAAGYALESLLGIPYLLGAALITVVMLLYTFRAGFRGVARTDVFQGVMMIVLLVVAVVVISERFGGLSAANRTAWADHPELFARPGLGGLYTPGVWFGYMLLWFLCDPMFPQLFQRFYAASSPRGLSTTMSLYPLLTGSLFLLPVTIGVLGRLSFPTLPDGMAADQILPRMLALHTPPWVEALVLTAALAALMSTLDSQLLTLSSMFTRDIVGPIREHLARRGGRAARPASPARSTGSGPGSTGQGSDTSETLRSDEIPQWVGKTFVVGLALAGVAIARHPPATFRALATETFTGLAVLFPTVITALYWPRMRAGAAIASIVVGEGLVAAHHFHLLPDVGTLPVVPIVAASTVVLLVGSVHLPIGRRGPRVAPRRVRRRRAAGWALVFAALFAAGHDLWNWNDGRLWLFGFPWWVWRYIGLCVLMSAVFWAFGRALERRDAASATRDPPQRTGDPGEVPRRLGAGR